MEENKQVKKEEAAKVAPVTNPKLVRVPVIDKETGEVSKYLDYYAEKWQVTKVVGRSEPYYTLKLLMINKAGKTMTVSANLNSDEVDYINFVNDDVLKKMRNNDTQYMMIKTRCMYGYNENGRLYAGISVLISDYIRKVIWFSPLQLSILKASFENEAKAFPFNWEEIQKLDDLDVSNIQFL